MTLGERIKRLRAERPQGEQSREAFAAALAVSKNTVVNYENDVRVPDAIFLNKIIELDPSINPSWLLTGDGEMRRVVRLNESKQLIALRERLKHKRVGGIFDGICMFHNIDKDIVDKYINGDYEPNEEEFRKICAIAGVDWNLELGKIVNPRILGNLGRRSHNNEEYEQKTNVEGFSRQVFLEQRPNKIDIDLLGFIITEIESAIKEYPTAISPKKKAELFALVYDESEGRENKEGVAMEKIKRLLRIFA